MNNPVLLIGAMLLLTVGTFAFRFAGPALRTQISFPPHARRRWHRDRAAPADNCGRTTAWMIWLRFLIAKT